MGRPRMVVPAVVAVMLAVAACSSGSGTDATVPDVRDAVVVASFAFPESELLGEIYSQTLEADGFAVERSFNIGPASWCCLRSSTGWSTSSPSTPAPPCSS